MDGKHVSQQTFAAMYHVDDTNYVLFEVYDDDYKVIGSAVGEIRQRYEPGVKGVFAGIKYLGTDNGHYRWYIENEGEAGGLPVNAIHHFCRTEPKACKAAAHGATIIHCRKWTPLPKEQANEVLVGWGYAGFSAATLREACREIDTKDAT